MGRECPRCMSPMVLLTKKNIELDACPQCMGIWFDKDELDKITDGCTSFEGLIFTAKSLGRKLSCPSCSKKMNFYTVEGVTVDFCQDCAGVWLDAGELSAIGGILQKKSKEASEGFCYEIHEEKAEGFFSKIKDIFKK